MVKLLVEHKAEVLAVLGNTVHESGPLAPAPRFDRIARVAEGDPGLKMPCAARRGRTQEVEGAFLHFCVECGAFEAFGYGVSLRAGRLVLRRASARSTVMNPLGPDPSLSDAARRMRRHREGAPAWAFVHRNGKLPTAE
jgi:hypothetical protein